MRKIEKNDELIEMMLERLPEKFHARVLAAVDAGISRQHLKILEIAMQHGVSEKELDIIQQCDTSSEAGLKEALALAGI